MSTSTASITITEATLNQTVLSSSGVIVRSLYTCRAVGIPLPLHISWRAQGNVTLLDNAVGVEITNTDEDNGATSVLSLSSDDFSSVVCVVTNGNYPGAMEEEFQGQIILISTYIISTSLLPITFLSCR